ncbi:tetratricopeptide repeat protein 38-like [Oscarella lobularis]|uniref:tetratricopeptide repeat protein 38-like n=1 Tax=Oscarella lobularis TaxID=121494 RepID=UPI0033139E62
MAHVCRTFLLLTVGSLTTDPNVQESAKVIDRRDRNDLAWREKRHVEAIERKLVNDERDAIDIWEDILLKFPTDIFAIRCVNDCYFFIGDSVNVRDSMARILPAWNESMTYYSHILGMYAFGLEESGLRSKAKETAERALALNPDLPWAIHALGHVYNELYSPEEGIDVLIKWKKHWEDGGLSGHLTWHLGLFRLDAGDLKGALREYDDVLVNGATDVFGFVGAVSLLWRIECTGFDVGEERWTVLQEQLKEYSNKHSMAWYDAHIMMAFACRGAKDRAARLLLGRNLLQSLKEYGGSAKTHNAWVTNEVGIPLCEALLAFGNEEYDKAVSLIVPIRYKCHALGWSVAQRHIIAVTLIRAAIQAKNFSLARALLSEMKELRPNHKATARLYLQVTTESVL